ncbi:MAG: ABC transporter substrate-binding protein [Crocosphaera sp.]
MNITTITKPRILVIFGSAENLNLQKDKEILKTLTTKGAKITWLEGSNEERITRNQLINLLSTQSWDMLFFSGHSYSLYDPNKPENGIISLNQNEKISLRELQTALNKAAQKGLKICIFNSCDGLSLARNCAEFGISNIIFMRQPIPDKVAHDFLEAFLSQFSQGESLDLSLRYSRNILEDKYEQTLPGISWLPTLYQKPTSPLIIWKSINNNKQWIWIIIPIVTLLISLSIYQLFKNKYPSNSRFTQGEISFFEPNKNNQELQQANQYYQQKKWKLAQDNFQKVLDKKKNNPEVIIYKNNAQAELNKNFKIAIVIPVNNPNIAQEMLRGVGQAQEEINQNGGINGRLLHITIVNDDNDPRIAQKVAKKLVENPEIMAVIGHNSSEVSLEGAKIYQQEGLVMINPTSSADGITDTGSYIFRTLPTIQSMARMLADYVKLNHKKIAICYNFQSLASQSFKDQFTAALGKDKDKLANSICDLFLPAFNADQEINEALDHGADTMLILPYIQQLDKAYELGKANQGRLQLLGPSILNTITTLQEGKSMEGLIIVVSWSPKNLENKQFAASARQFWGGNVSWRTATTYDATYVLINGLKQGQTRDTLQDALDNPQFSSETINGEVKFLANGDRKGQSILIQVQRSRNHPTGYDFQILEPKKN